MDVLKGYEKRGYDSWHRCRGNTQLADPQTRVKLYRERFWKGWGIAEYRHKKSPLRPTAGESIINQ